MGVTIRRTGLRLNRIDAMEGSMEKRQTGKFGSWNSPITADAVSAQSVSLSAPQIDGDNVYWIEGRPLEKGRNVVVVRAADGTIVRPLNEASLVAAIEQLAAADIEAVALCFINSYRNPVHARQAEAFLKKSGVATTAYFGPEAEFYIFNSVRFDQNAHEGYYHIDSEEGIWNSGTNGTANEVFRKLP